jgi:hypothetical protein
MRREGTFVTFSRAPADAKLAQPERRRGVGLARARVLSDLRRKRLSEPLEPALELLVRHRQRERTQPRAHVQA